MVVLGSFLASVWIAYHAPTLFISIPLIFLTLYGLLNTTPWWSLLIQVLVGFGFAMGIIRGWLLNERWRVLRPFSSSFNDSRGFEAADVIDFFTALLSAAAFGFLYPLQRPLDDSIPIVEYGAMIALILVFMWLVISYLAKLFWFRYRNYEPGMLYLLVEFSAIVLCFDLLVFGAKAPSRIGAGVLLGVRYSVLIIQEFVFTRRK
jgi:hypothetical protein